MKFNAGAWRGRDVRPRRKFTFSLKISEIKNYENKRHFINSYKPEVHFLWNAYINSVPMLNGTTRILRSIGSIPTSGSRDMKANTGIIRQCNYANEKYI
jgi:hypothetical protein